MFVAVSVRQSRRGLGGGASGKRQSGHAKACSASPPAVARITRLYKARNAHHAYSGHPPAQASSLKRQARDGDRIFPNHQARCALLNPLRFEFANEFRPRKPNDKHPRCACRALIRFQEPTVHFIPPARSDAQSRQQRGRPGAEAPSNSLAQLWRLQFRETHPIAP